MTERATFFTSGQNTQVPEIKGLEDICLRAIHSAVVVRPNEPLNDARQN